MRILYVGMKYDYGKPQQGCSFEHWNFFHSLHQLGHDILYFDFMTLLARHGREGMNRRLVEVARAEKPDVMFTILFQDEFKPEAVRAISESGHTTTLNWFCDDHWRFENFSRRWAPCFNWVVTTAGSAMPKYEALGYRNVIKSQWACNHVLYRKVDLPLKYDVTFVGQPHGNRPQTIQALRDAGFKVRCWGTGWESGRLSQEAMIEVFNQSRVNLNLSNSSMPDNPSRGMRIIRRLARPALRIMPRADAVKSFGKKMLARRPGSAAAAEVYGQQIKGRNFELPGCGGFTLSGNTDNLADYYRIGSEVACFGGPQELADKVGYYLRQEEQRSAIAAAGYERTLREHTYAHRFRAIFARMGLAADECATALCTGKPGSVEDIA